MVGIESYGVALPTLRLPASAYIEAWGACAARGLKQKAFCAYDEDPVTLGIEASRQALARLSGGIEIGALFFGVTTPPFEEKPSAATLPTALFENTAMRVTEITGSPQAGVQALVSAIEYCMAGKGRYALAVAADAPSGPADASYEHALGAGAAAFVVGPDGGVASFDKSFGVTRETFGSRFRRHGDNTLSDLELRTRDSLASARTLGAELLASNLGKVKRLALGADAGLMRGAGRALGLPEAEKDALWRMIGDAGSASAPFALAAALDVMRAGDKILCAGIGSGATAALLTAGKELSKRRRKGAKVADLITGGKMVDYVTYLKHRRMLSSRFGGNG
jgi:hydroxymethylglutaryl-CoA synthase